MVTDRRQKWWPHLRQKLSAIDDGMETSDVWPEFSDKLWRLSGGAFRLEAGFSQSAKKPEIGMEPGYFFFEGPLLFRAPSVVRTAE